MIYPLIAIPAAYDAPVSQTQPPLRIKMTDEFGRVTFRSSCGVCDKPTVITEFEYDAELIPVCNCCRADAAELMG